MGRSLSLAAYLAYSRRHIGPVPEFALSRPAGELVWAHAADSARADVLVHLAERLRQQRSGLTVLLTVSARETPPAPSGPVITLALPEDAVNAAEAFLDHFTPAICLWTGGNLLPAMISCADQRGLPMFLIDAERDLLIRPGWRWFPDLPRALLSRFTLIMARDESTAQEIRRIGAGEAEIAVSGALMEGSAALPFNESDFRELSALLRGRQVWLAVHLQHRELDIVLRAHRTVSKLAHRALLVIVPADSSRGDMFAQSLETGGWRYIRWSDGQFPEETSQVLLADTCTDLGLWYRLAATTLMGSSLQSGPGGRDPNEPAAHGSAILYGPNVGRHLSSYSRFAEAGAARIVRDADTLAGAVTRLIAPDQSAAMAHAAWDVASRGAAVTDRVVDLVQDTLDVVGARR